jgi:hypothetical protein
MLENAKFNFGGNYAILFALMSIFTHSIPVLPVRNITNALKFYDRLGFQSIWEDFDYAIIERDAVEIHLMKCIDPRIAENSTCRILVTSIEELFTLFQILNIIQSDSTLTVEPWGSRAFSVLDPDGNMLKFIEKLPPKRTIKRATIKKSDTDEKKLTRS